MTFEAHCTFNQAKLKCLRFMFTSLHHCSQVSSTSDVSNESACEDFGNENYEDADSENEGHLSETGETSSEEPWNTMDQESAEADYEDTNEAFVTSDDRSKDETVLDEVLCPCSTSTVGDAMLMAVALGFRHNLSWLAVTDVLKMVNVLYGKKIVPSTKYFLMKYFEVGREDTIFHVYCPVCEKYLGKREEVSNDEGIVSCTCGQRFQTTSTDSYFLSVNMKGQLQDLFKNDTFVRLLEYRNERPKPKNGAVDDILDGARYRDLSAPGGILSSRLNYSYTFKTDGVPIGKSSKQSMWPIYATINELPQGERSKHLLLAGIWVGKKNPSMTTFLKPFVNEANSLSEEGIDWTRNGEKVNSKIIPLCCTVDSVARCKILNMSQFDGYYGCTLCYHKSERTIKGLRFTVSSRKYPKRTHESIAGDMVKSLELGNKDGNGQSDKNKSKKKKTTVKGVKGPSTLLLMRYLDLGVSIVPEYMHGVCLGVTRLHTDLLRTSVGKDFYVGTDTMIAGIDSRLKFIRPPTSITRHPRGLSECALWKATEWRSWLLFYAIPCLEGFLGKKYLAHLALLSKAIYLLSQKSVSPEDIQVARKLLTKYIKKFQKYFGKTAMVYNIHLLSHLCDAVINFGPLWTHDAFMFEGENRLLLQFQQSPSSVAKEVTRKFLMSKALPNLCVKYSVTDDVLQFCEDLSGKSLKHFVRCGECVLVGSGVAYTFGGVETAMLATLGIYDYAHGKTFSKIIYGGVRLCTTDYSADKKNNDSIVFANNMFMIIHKIVLVSERVVFFAQKLSVCKQPVLNCGSTALEHVKKVKREGKRFFAIEPHDLSNQCVHMCLENCSYVSILPFGCYGD